MELFKGWFSDHFLKHAVASRPILLLLDGHSSHYNPGAIRHAKESDIVLFTLVPHTMHEMQPLDTSVFGPLKSNWHDACHKFTQDHPGRIITKYQFSSLLSEAWMKLWFLLQSSVGLRLVEFFLSIRRPYLIMIHVLVEIPILKVIHRMVTLNRIHQTLTPSMIHPTVILSLIHGMVTELDPLNGDAPDDKQVKEFSVEQELLYETRYSEGYNLNIDPDYIAWLEINHPETLPVGRNQDPTADVSGSCSLTDPFATVSPQEPLPTITDSTPSGVESPVSSHNPVGSHVQMSLSRSLSPSIRQGVATPACTQSLTTPPSSKSVTPPSSKSATPHSNKSATHSYTSLKQVTLKQVGYFSLKHVGYSSLKQVSYS